MEGMNGFKGPRRKIIFAATFHSNPGALKRFYHKKGEEKESRWKI
jgi:hypothetical protein